MSLFVCAKCGCVDNTATSSYWMLTNEYMVDKFEYAKELQPYKGMGLCSECGRLTTSPSGMDRWEYKNSQYDCFKQSTGYFFHHAISAVIFPCQSTN